MTTFTVVVTAGLAAAVLWLLVRLLREQRARGAARAAYLDRASGLFGSVTIRTQPSGFARMAGVWQGARFDLQAVPDTLTFRKLPVLWVMVTLTEPMPLDSAVHIMARPGQSDIFSNFDQMPVSVALPDGFPEFCALRCGDAAALPDPCLIAGQATLFAVAHVKELVMSPKGLRLVILADEAERGAYLLFRDAEMGQQPLEPDRLLPLLQALLALRDELQAARERTDG